METPLTEEVDGDTWPRDDAFFTELDKDRLRWRVCGILVDLTTSLHPSYGCFFVSYIEISLWHEDSCFGKMTLSYWGPCSSHINWSISSSLYWPRCPVLFANSLADNSQHKELFWWHVTLFRVQVLPSASCMFAKQALLLSHGGPWCTWCTDEHYVRIRPIIAFLWWGDWIP